MSAPRLSIRAARYRGRDGFAISGRDVWGRRVRVFAETREAAEVARDRLKAGLDPFPNLGDLTTPASPLVYPDN